MRASTTLHMGVLVLAAASTSTREALAQSALDTPANIAHGWVGSPGVIQFNLVHRFDLGPAPSRKLTNSPTFTLATGFRPWGTVGLNYASNSELVPGYPNEWEFFARVAAVRQDSGGPLDLTIQGGHNVAANSQDGGIVLGRRFGPLRVLVHGAAFSNAFDSGMARFAAGTGAVVRLSPNFALSGDITTLTNRAAGERSAWSAGIQLGVPYTPHSLSLHATNVNSRTLEGIARGSSTTRYGFEYTIPINVRRYLPVPGAAMRVMTSPSARFTSALARRLPASRVHPASRADHDTVRVEIRELVFRRAKLEIPIGTTVIWTNRDPIAHAVVADGRAFDSGLVEPNKSWQFTFTKAGTYSYHCMPHPFMKATVVVQ